MRFRQLPSLLLFSLLTVTSVVSGQHMLEITPKFAQVRDVLSNQMVFEGPGISFAYRLRSEGDNFTQFRAGFEGTALFNREILGIAASLTPVDYLHALPVYRHGNSTLYLGIRGRLIYHFQLYPDLQTGHDFWLTEAGIAPAVVATLPGGVTVHASVTLLSAISRTPDGRDPHVFSLQASDIIADLHRDMHLAGPDRYRHFALSVEYPLTRSGNWRLEYGMDYRDYNAHPALDMLHHALSINIVLGE